MPSIESFGEVASLGLSIDLISSQRRSNDGECFWPRKFELKENNNFTYVCI